MNDKSGGLKTCRNDEGDEVETKSDHCLSARIPRAIVDHREEVDSFTAGTTAVEIVSDISKQVPNESRFAVRHSRQDLRL